MNIQLLAGKKLKKLIKEYYTSQEEFAFDFGCDVRTINRYINNGINKIDIIQEFAEKFDVPFEYFITNDEDVEC